MALTVKEFNQFVNDLARHDWYYDCSDDARVYRNGQNVEQLLKKQAASHPVLQSAFDAWSARMFGFHALEDRAKACDTTIAMLRKNLLGNIPYSDSQVPTRHHLTLVPSPRVTLFRRF